MRPAPLITLTLSLFILSSCHSDGQQKKPADNTVSSPGTVSTTDTVAAMYTDLKRLSYSFPFDSTHLPDPGVKEMVYGVIMDWDMGNAIITLVSFRTGDASLYYSTGGGMMGGVGHPEIRMASITLCDEAQKMLSAANAKDTTLRIDKGMVKFYLMTNKGKYTIKGPVDNIENTASDLYSIFSAANNVITQFRLTQDKK